MTDERITEMHRYRHVRRHQFNTSRCPSVRFFNRYVSSESQILNIRRGIIKKKLFTRKDKEFFDLFTIESVQIRPHAFGFDYSTQNL